MSETTKTLVADPDKHTVIEDLDILKESVAVSCPTEIATDVQYALASDYLRDWIKLGLKEIEGRFVKQREADKESRALQKELEAPLKAEEKLVKGFMVEYQRASTRKKEKFLDIAKTYMLEEAKTTRGNELQGLVEKGETLAALELSRQPIDPGIDLGEVDTGTFKTASSSVSRPFVWKMKDASKIRKEFLSKPIPDSSKITRLVGKKGFAAEEEIGLGSVEIEQDYRVSSLSERKRRTQ